MGTEVLRPHDCLTERIRLPPAIGYPRRRRSRTISNDLKPSKQKQNQPQRLAMGQITILKRGEPLDLKPRAAKLIVSGTERIGPDPVTVTKQVRFRDPKTESPSPTAAVYAGSAFSVSPSPESLPLPSFSKIKQVSMTVDDSATRDLRRLLRLD